MTASHMVDDLLHTLPSPAPPAAQQTSYTSQQASAAQILLVLLTSQPF